MSRVSVILVTGLLACGCSTSTSRTSLGTVEGQRAECLVCKHNADLACVNIKVDDETPQAIHAGRTYYFCSEGCREEFVGRPERFAQTRP